MQWPPPYRLRRSMRAKRISLTIDPRFGLEIILPKRSSEREALLFLHNQKTWVEKHAEVLSRPVQESPLITNPELINLAAISSEFAVRYYEVVSASRVKLFHSGKEIILSGAISNIHMCLHSIKTWLKQQAKLHLSSWVEQISNTTGLCYHSLSFRGQKTLWGSCSPNHDISLNYKLLFLPLKLVRYVIIHELCHTKYLDHSKKFWSLVATWEPEFAVMRKELRRAEVYLPNWIQEM